MKNYNRFTKENTQGFCDIELSWMNFCFDSQMDFAKNRICVTIKHIKII